MDQRLLGMIVTKMLVPRGNNHSTLNEGDLILMYYIQHNIQVDWIYVFRDHMLKAKRLTILGCHMWFWCQSLLNTLELM